MANIEGDLIEERRVAKPNQSGLIERQFQIIVEGLQIEYAGRVHGLIDLCSDSRFTNAKKAAYASLPKEKVNELLHKLF